MECRNPKTMLGKGMKLIYFSPELTIKIQVCTKPSVCESDSHMAGFLYTYLISKFSVNPSEMLYVVLSINHCSALRNFNISVCIEQDIKFHNYLNNQRYYFSIKSGYLYFMAHFKIEVYLNLPKRS